MRKLVLLVALGLAAMGCGGVSSPQQDLIGDWIYIVNNGSSGAAVSYKADGTYVGSILVLTSTTTANAQVELGNYTATSNELTSVPTEWTCPGPDPASTVSYAISDGHLVVSTSSGIISFAQNTAPASTTFTLTYGCMKPDGSFVASPLAPVTNQ
jgi:hypothetical protein